MKFKSGDPVWVLTTGCEEFPAGKMFIGEVVGPAEEWDRRDYVVDVPAAPSLFCGTKRWCFEWQLFPRFNGEGLKATPDSLADMAGAPSVGRQ